MALQAFRVRRATVVVIHATLTVLSTYIAFSIRFDGIVPQDPARALRDTAGLLILIRLMTFLSRGLHNRLWRNTSLREAARIAAAAIAGDDERVLDLLKSIVPTYERGAVEPVQIARSNPTVPGTTPGLISGAPQIVRG